MNKPNDTHKLLPLSELQSGQAKRVMHKGKAILLCRVGDEVHAVDDLCTHEDISLSLGVLCENRLRCPLHGSEFDIRTGKVLTEPADTDLACHDIEVAKGWVCLKPV